MALQLMKPGDRAYKPRHKSALDRKMTEEWLRINDAFVAVGTEYMEWSEPSLLTPDECLAFAQAMRTRVNDLDIRIAAFRCLAQSLCDKRGKAGA